eukprot:PhM_4_TR11997/c0_g1_i1/m.72931/K00798/MMAB, pduO; cob(I)alamin adenosyltransferase
MRRILFCSVPFKFYTTYSSTTSTSTSTTTKRSVMSDSNDKASAIRAEKRAAALKKRKAITPEMEELHKLACLRGEETYEDPVTGYVVFTAVAHKARGYCCGSGCRHCPFGHRNVGDTESLHSDKAAVKSGNKLDYVEQTDILKSTPPPPGSAQQHRAAYYTRTGDKGTSGLCGGERRSKSDPVFDVLGGVDELSSHIGLALSSAVADGLSPNSNVYKLTQEVQIVLMDCMTVVATPPEDPDATEPDVEMQYSLDTVVTTLEHAMDVIDAELPKLRAFVVPGGSIAASHFHVARAVCRRCERLVVALGRADVSGVGVGRVLNRLADYLFVVARHCAYQLKAPADGVQREINRRPSLFASNAMASLFDKSK